MVDGSMTAAVEVVKSRLAEHEAAAAECRVILTLLGADPEDEDWAADDDDVVGEGDEGRPEPSPKPVRRATAPGKAGASGGVHHKTAARQLRQVAIARWLTGHEPATAGEIAAGCSIPQGTLSSLLDSPWFERTGGNPRDPWRLTDEGKAELGRRAGPGSST